MKRKRWLRLPATRRSIARDVRAELNNHLEESVDSFQRRGMSPDEARSAALRQLGSLEDAERELIMLAQSREDRMKVHDWFESLVDDLRYTSRGLVAHPSFTALVLATLTLGIGANVAMFSVIDRVLIQGPEHLRDPDRIRRFYLTFTPPGMAVRAFSYTSMPLTETLRRDSSTFASVAAYGATQTTLGHGENARRLVTTSATGGFFRTLGVRPALGRFFEEFDVDINAEPTVAVISHTLWQNQFGGASSVTDQWITLDGRRYRIIGVAPRNFTGPEFKPVDVWLPMGVRFGPFPGWATSWSAPTMQVVVRLSDGVSPEQAADRATLAYRVAYPGSDQWRKDGVVTFLPLRTTPSGAEPMEFSVSRWLFGVAVLVLITAFANVANMLLARSASRQREIAVRLALGIQRWRLTRLLLGESMILAIAGGALGLLVGAASSSAIRVALFPEMPKASLMISPRLALFAVTATLVTGLTLGITAAMRSAPSNVTASLKEGAQRGGIHRRRLGAALTVAQASLSVVLLVGSGLFLLSLARVRQVDLGMRPDRVVYASINWQAGTTAPQRQEVWQRAYESLRRNSLVRHVSVSRALPFQSTGISTIRIPGRDSLPTLPGGGPFVNLIGTSYFTTLGSTIVAGRDFADSDGDFKPPPAIISETTARLLWPGTSAVGKCLFVGEEASCSPVIGVVNDSRRFALREEPALQVFTPLPRGEDGNLLAQVDGQVLLAFQASLRTQLARLDPAVAYVAVGSLQDAIDPKVRPWKLGASMFTVFGALALAIATIGLYTIVSYATANRTHEIGVRIAFGASLRDIVSMVIASGMKAVGLGIALGIAIALVAGARLQPLLFETSARDPLVFLAVAVVLILSAVAACLVPSRRAARVDPVTALRAE